MNMITEIWRHLRNWAEVYLWVPVSLFSIYILAQFGYFLTGRRPTENVDWIIGLAGNLVTGVFAIALVSIFIQSTGIWLTKAERLQPGNQTYSIAQMVVAILALCVFGYILKH